AGQWRFFLDNGTLRIQNAGALGTGTGAIQVDDFNETLEIDGVTLNRAINLSSISSAFTLLGTGAARYNGTLTVSNGASVVSTTLATGASASDVLTIGDAANDYTGGNSSSTRSISGSGKVILAFPTNYAGNWQVNTVTHDGGTA